MAVLRASRERQTASKFSAAMAEVKSGRAA